MVPLVNVDRCDLQTANGKLLSFNTNSIVVFSENLAQLQVITIFGMLKSVHLRNNSKVGAMVHGSILSLFDLNLLTTILSIQTDSTLNSIVFNEFNLAIASANNSIHVHDIKTGGKKYLLLGGSMNPKTLPKSFKPNPLKQGCSEVLLNNERIIGAFGNLLRIYHFDTD